MDPVASGFGEAPPLLPGFSDSDGEPSSASEFPDRSRRSATNNTSSSSWRVSRAAGAVLVVITLAVFGLVLLHRPSTVPSALSGELVKTAHLDDEAAAFALKRVAIANRFCEAPPPCGPGLLNGGCLQQLRSWGSGSACFADPLDTTGTGRGTVKVQKAVSRQDCFDKCDRDFACTGLEYVSDSQLCKRWTVPICSHRSVVAKEGLPECVVKVPSLPVMTSAVMGKLAADLPSRARVSPFVVTTTTTTTTTTTSTTDTTTSTSSETSTTTSSAAAEMPSPLIPGAIVALRGGRSREACCMTAWPDMRCAAGLPETGCFLEVQDAGNDQVALRSFAAPDLPPLGPFSVRVVYGNLVQLWCEPCQAWCSDAAGGFRCNRGAPDTWETFEVKLLDPPNASDSGGSSTTPTSSTVAELSTPEYSCIDLRNKLQQDPTGQNICGKGSHVCNFQETTINAILRGKGPATSAWIVASTGESSVSINSIWSGQALDGGEFCNPGRCPAWQAIGGGIAGAVVCQPKEESRTVACCKTVSSGGRRLAPGTIKLSKWRGTQPQLETQLRDQRSAASVCGTGRHECNYQEVTVYGILAGSAPQGWIVGGDSGAVNLRTLWSGNDVTMCRDGRQPFVDASSAPYVARVSCADTSSDMGILCCPTLASVSQSSVVKLVAPAKTFTDVETSLKGDNTGKSVCGMNYHICNYQEATVWMSTLGLDLGEDAWAVGSYGDSAKNIRAVFGIQNPATCSNPPALIERRNCGYDFDEQGCTDRGCCWDPANPTPQCFLPEAFNFCPFGDPDQKPTGCSAPDTYTDAKNLEQCEMLCRLTPKCNSFNYDQVKGICELLECPIPTTLPTVSASGFQYYIACPDIQVPSLTLCGSDDQAPFVFKAASGPYYGRFACADVTEQKKVACCRDDGWQFLSQRRLRGLDTD